MDRNLFVPGRKVSIETRLGLVALKAESRIVGVRDPGYVLVDAPTASGFPVLTERGQACLLRIRCEGRMIGIPAWLHSTLRAPFALSILRHSGKARQTVVRRHARVECNFGAALQPCVAAAPAGEGSAAESVPEGEVLGAVIDLSIGGCQVVLPLAGADGTFAASLGWAGKAADADRAFYEPKRLARLFAVKRTINVSFEMPKPVAGYYETPNSHVRWSHQNGSAWFVGLQFCDFDANTREAISRIVAVQRRFYIRPIDTGE